MTPDDIHRLGLEEVKRIRDEMSKSLRKLISKAASRTFCSFLRTDPQFYYDNAGRSLRGLSRNQQAHRS